MALSVPSSQPGNGDIRREKENPFPRFEVVSDSSDHYYAGNKAGGGKSFTNMSSRVYKKIMQEWKILEKHLPDSIFVRAYENRIDLLRTVIIGAKGTPYHDGLYFLDMAFPSNYPDQPPLLYYRSFGLAINPNLYSNGRVCLSLVNTWQGNKNEKWSPNKSTVLQVLLSIQALVLNEKPYFNEPGHRIFPGLWEKQANAYNEDVFILSCKTMMHVLRKPPKNFESFVVRHFKERADVILSACNAYMNGTARVGCYSTDASSTTFPAKVQVSGRFKALIRKSYPELVAGFISTGAAVRNLQVESPSKTQKVVKKESEIGHGWKVLGKLKKVLQGFKTKKDDKGSAEKITSSS